MSESEHEGAQQRGATPEEAPTFAGMTRCHGDNFVIESLNLFCRMLEAQGVSSEVLGATLQSFVDKMDAEGKGVRMLCNYKDVVNEQERQFDAVRKDYWGRALFMNLDRYFVTDRLEGHKILNEPIPGKLPRQILPGLIELVKSNQPSSQLLQYDTIFQTKATRYRRKEDGLVDMVSFANDGEVRSIAANMISGVRRMFDTIPEDERKGWLLKKIGQNPSFEVMKRPLSDDEYSHIIDAIFQR